MKALNFGNILLHFVVFANGLNLMKHHIANNFYVSSIAIYRSRAFLTLPRSSCYNNITYPTLIEVHWSVKYNTLLAGKRIYYPSEKQQRPGKCDVLQNTVAVDVETKYARLWILDKGTKKCPPKIIIYNLHINKEIYTCVLNELSNKNVNSLVIDVDGDYGTNAYVGLSGDDKLIVFCFERRLWLIVRVTTYNGMHPVSTEHLSISPIKPVLYVTSHNNTEIFRINLTRVRSMGQDVVKGAFPKAEAIYLGPKLGPSGGIVADYVDGLSYYLTNDFAVVRWITSKSLVAENHAVLGQSYEYLPYVPHLFLGLQNTMWALVNPLRPQECSTQLDRRNTKLPETTYLNRRIVKICKLRGKGDSAFAISHL